MKTYKYKSRTMGTDLEVEIITEKEDDETSVSNADIAYGKIEMMCIDYEKRFSRFLPESELSMVNTTKKRTVSHEFMRVLRESSRLYYLTNGIFNPLCSPVNLGYTETFDELDREQNASYSSEFSSDFDLAGLVSEEDTTVLLQENQTLDFGGFLKGYVAYKAATTLREFAGGVVNIGGDIVLRGQNLDGNDFKLTIADPFDVTRAIGNIILTNASIATSSPLKRNWSNKNKTYNHIIDPRSKDSVRNNIASVTVISEDGGVADAFATVGDILGIDEGLEFFNEKKLAALYVDLEGKLFYSEIMKELFIPAL